MKFTKMQGCGNDYVYVNCFEEEVLDPAELAKRVSNRNFGIGSDGLILIRPSQTEDFTMHMYNADGSQGDMCGNGIRCVAKYVYEHGMTNKTELSIETISGPKALQLTVKDKKVTEVTVDMGAPIVEPELIPVLTKNDGQLEKQLKTEHSNPLIHEAIQIRQKEFFMTCISVGNPHAVVFVEEVKQFPVKFYGSEFENHPRFPKKINTEFVEVVSPKEIRMRVWERGSGETFACGSGATASVYACILNHKTEEEVLVHMLGGDLRIRYDKEKNHLFMTGPAVIVFEGEWIE